MQKKRFLWVGGIGTVLWLYMLAVRKIWLAQTAKELVRVMADAFTLPGMALLLIGALFYAVKHAGKRFGAQPLQAPGATSGFDNEKGTKELWRYTFALLVVGAGSFGVAIVLNVAYACV